MLRATLTRRAASQAASGADAAATTPLRQTLQESVASSLLSSRYLRHAPPRLYVTCAHDQGLAASACGRHMTKVIDVSLACSADAPPHTQSVYLLTSTALGDTDFKDTSAQSQVLVGLPQVRDADAVLRFCDTHGPSLAQVHHIVLPGDVTPTQSLLIKTLLHHLPQARLVCNAFGQALLTSPLFHDGVRRAVLENTPSVAVDILRFAELPATRVSAVKDGDAVSVDVATAAAATTAAAAAATTSPARRLRVVGVTNAAQEQRRKARSQTNHPAYFDNAPLFFFDDAFHALFVGLTLHRLPWLPTVLSEARREAVLPLPPSLALQHPTERPNLLLDSWRVTETSAAVVDALRRTPELERVLSGSFGELSGNVEDCVGELERSGDALEGLRSRLAHRLASDASRDVHRWSTALLRRVVQEVVCVQKASEPTTPAVLGQFLSWASKDGEWGRLATCLSHSAMVLPPTTPAPAPAAAPSSVVTGSEGVEAVKSTEEIDRPLEGQSGVDLLVAIFEKKGLQGLTRTVKRETIDVQVFLAMSEGDLKAVFKATFGITKRLSLLQEELRRNV